MARQRRGRGCVSGRCGEDYQRDAAARYLRGRCAAETASNELAKAVIGISRKERKGRKGNDFAESLRDELGEPFFGLTRYVNEEERNGVVCEGENGRMYVRYDGATVISWKPAILQGGEVFFLRKEKEKEMIMSIQGICARRFCLAGLRFN